MSRVQKPRVSVVIPAHDEATVLGRCLAGLQPAVAAGWAEVLVVCNGCDDDTARVARAHRGVTVLELSEASKIAALRAGDATARVFPRVYLDADVLLPSEALEDLVLGMEETGAPAGRPSARLDTSACSWPVRRFYAARSRVRSLNTALWGAGVYALSRDGRSRFHDWPDVVADDLFIDGLFTRGEVLLVNALVTVYPPRRAADLLRTLRRVYRGNRERSVLSTIPAPRSTSTSTATALLRTAASGATPALDAVTYAALVTAARLPTRHARALAWERDESTRASS